VPARLQIQPRRRAVAVCWAIDERADALMRSA
jgi:hypothetical protein